MDTNTNGFKPGFVTSKRDSGLIAPHDQPAKQSTFNNTNFNGDATVIAKLALAGHVVHKGNQGDFTVCKFGLTRYCADFTALVAFAKKVGAA